MPEAPPTRCAEPGCTELTTATRCPEHRRAQAAARRARRHPDTTSWGPGSTRRWRTLRARVLAEEEFCRRCGFPASEVDHIIPLAADGDRWDRDNLQALCGDCHTDKTSLEVTTIGPVRHTYRVDTRVIVISGSPCAGKTTHTAARAQPGDLVWDHDTLAAALGSPGSHQHPAWYTPFLAEMREAFLRRLTRPHPAPRVWIVTTDPALADRLPGAQHLRLHATRGTCHQRAAAAGRPDRWHELIDMWHDQHAHPDQEMTR